MTDRDRRRGGKKSFALIARPRRVTRRTRPRPSIHHFVASRNPSIVGLGLLGKDIRRGAARRMQLQPLLGAQG